MTGREEILSRAEALKRAKEECKLDKMTNSVQHNIHGLTGESLVLTQDSLPELPTIHFKNCNECSFSIPVESKVVKVLFESCIKSKLKFEGCTISTGTVEVWRCDGCELLVDCSLGTLQVDVCNGLVVTYSKTSHMGMVVQAGMKDLVLRFADGGAEDYHTGLDQLRGGQAGANAASMNDTTDQCITRFVEGKLLTERIIRLANDYPTTAREKAAFDAEARKKAAAMEGLVKDLLDKQGVGNQGKLSEEEARRLRELSEQQHQVSADNDDCSDAARAQHRRAQGNEAFKVGDFQQAAVCYTEALAVDDKEAALYSNRAACFLKLGQADRALADAERCVALDPAAVKGHFRRGVALMALERPEEAAAAMARVLDLDPRNADARATLQLAQAKAARMRAAR